MSSGKVLLGVLAGVAAGALIGILFAPDKGSATRKKLSKKGEDFADELKVNFEKFIDGISTKFDEVVEDYTGSAERAKTKSATDKGTPAG